jgi:cytochrome c-type biogenesis protein CcmH
MTPWLFAAVALPMTALVLAWVLRPLLARRAADERAAGIATETGRRRSRRAGVGVALALPLAAAGLYALLGEPAALAPGNELDAQSAYATLPATAVRDELVAHLARNPRDARGFILLARLDFAEDRFADAAGAYAKAIAASTRVEADPEIWCEYADALGMAQGGSLAGEPRELVMRALARKPTFPKALEMAGSAAFEAGDYLGAAGYWRVLVAQMPPEAPARRDLIAATARAELLASAGAR